jgi:hypothetical protein
VVLAFSTPRFVTDARASRALRRSGQLIIVVRKCLIRSDFESRRVYLIGCVGAVYKVCPIHVQTSSPVRIPNTDGVETVSKDSKLYSLNRYFIWANRMKSHFAEAIQEQGDPPSGGIERRMWLSAPFSYACYWFAILHVVVEGMQELKLTNPSLSTLLKDDDKLEKLRRFRNGVYHFQPNYFDDRFKDFLSDT